MQLTDTLTLSGFTIRIDLNGFDIVAADGETAFALETGSVALIGGTVKGGGKPALWVGGLNDEAKLTLTDTNVTGTGTALKFYGGEATLGGEMRLVGADTVLTGLTGAAGLQERAAGTNASPVIYWNDTELSGRLNAFAGTTMVIGMQAKTPVLVTISDIAGYDPLNAAYAAAVTARTVEGVALVPGADYLVTYHRLENGVATPVLDATGAPAAPCCRACTPSRSP